MQRCNDQREKKGRTKGRGGGGGIKKDRKEEKEEEFVKYPVADWLVSVLQPDERHATP